ncbi:MAG: hypothetical protein DRH50_08390 [Deltaproteobacteria bacterium]|nr:MAG: hypothetical protein DRH50_08390 [Deltaproteobacteria bacterium]
MNSDGPGNSHVITRIISLSIKNFRGFPGEHKIDTNADLVLLSGPNGYGKTSFMEALLLLLTGYRYAKRSELLINKNAKDFEIGAKIKLDGKDKGKSSLSISYDRDTSESLEELWFKSLASCVGEPQIRESELNSRLCGFFQDRVEALFDETTSGATLRDIFEPLPKWLKDADDYLRYKESGEGGHRDLGEAASELKRKLENFEKEWNARDNYFVNRIDNWPDNKVVLELNQTWDGFIPLYASLVNGSEGWPEPPKQANNKNLTGFTLKVLRKTGNRLPTSGTEETCSNLPDLLISSLNRELDHQLKKTRREAARTTPDSRKIQERLDETNAEIERIRKKFPNLDEELGLFRTDSKGLPDLKPIFLALSENVSRWAKTPIHEGHLSRVKEELEAVVATEAEKCAKLLDEWLTPREEAKEEIIKLERKITELKRKLKASLASDEIDHLKKLKKDLDICLKALKRPWSEMRERQGWQEEKQRREGVREYLKSTLSLIERASMAIESVSSPNHELMEKFRKLIQDVLSRFSLVDNIVPLKLNDKERLNATKKDEVRRSYSIVTKDGRRLGDLSTGQKAQMAVSVLAAQNLAISHMLHHRIILLDDVTTAYDLSNLTREAILWRQLAYGGQEERARRQVFISSHHEDMTNHFLDLLVPPEGRSMRLIRFTGWDPKDGPRYKQFKIEPTGATLKDGELAERTQNLIKDLGTGPWRLL